MDVTSKNYGKWKFGGVHDPYLLLKIRKEQLFVKFLQKKILGVAMMHVLIFLASIK